MIFTISILFKFFLKKRIVGFLISISYVKFSNIFFSFQFRIKIRTSEIYRVKELNELNDRIEFNELPGNRGGWRIIMDCHRKILIQEGEIGSSSSSSLPIRFVRILSNFRFAFAITRWREKWKKLRDAINRGGHEAVKVSNDPV